MEITDFQICAAAVLFSIIYSIVESNDRISSRALTQTILTPFADCCAVMKHPVLTVMPVRILVGLANELACAVIVFDLVF